MTVQAAAPMVFRCICHFFSGVTTTTKKIPQNLQEMISSKRSSFLNLKLSRQIWIFFTDVIIKALLSCLILPNSSLWTVISPILLFLEQMSHGSTPLTSLEIRLSNTYFFLISREVFWT